MNVFDRVDGLNKRIRELELELRVHKLEKVLRELIAYHGSDVDNGLDELLTAARTVIAEAEPEGK